MSWRLLIAPDGEPIDPSTGALWGRLGINHSNVDVLDYAIRNMGFTELRPERDRLWISARPAVISPDAVKGTAEATRGWPDCRVVLRTFEFEGGWQTTIFTTVTSALSHLRALAREHSNHSGWSSFQAHPVKLEQLEGRAYDGMHLLLGEWAMLGGWMDDEMHHEFLHRRMPSNTALARRSQDGEGIVVAHVQVAGCPPAAAWVRRARGRDLRDHEDRGYAKWLMETYQHVLDRDEPRLEAVEATLRCLQFGSRSFSYDRLILPWKRPRGDKVATLVSVVREMTPERSPNIS
jgi:hypothetical protein